VTALPLLEVDWQLVGDQDFRALLAALSFEASYDPIKSQLIVRVTLLPELTQPDGPRAPLSLVPPARHSLHLCTDDMGFRGGGWLSREVLRFRDRAGHANPARGRYGGDDYLSRSP